MSNTFQPNRATGTPELTVIADTATLTKLQNYVAIKTGDGAFTLTLPHVADAVGCAFSLVKVDSSTNACTVADSGGAEDWSNLSLDALNDSVVLWSNGYSWNIISNQIAGSEFISGGAGGATYFNYQESLDDDSTYAMTSSGEGFLVVQAEDDEALVVAVEAAGTLTLIVGTTNTAITDSDTDLCVYNNSGTVTIKNRLGATKTVTVFGFLM